jgi:hypothetical protein
MEKERSSAEKYELRALRSTANGKEWSLGIIWDSYRNGVLPAIDSKSYFGYNSSTVSLGYGISLPSGRVNVYGAELGIMRFSADASTPNFYTAERENTRTTGHAAVLAATYGRSVSVGSLRLIPTLRVATNYPDFGGGDGYSRLHRESDFGFKASFGIRVAAPALRK